MSEQSKISLIKQVYGINTYTKVIDTEFSEFIKPIVDIEEEDMTVSEFFQNYEKLFYDIPISGSINSHAYIVERGTQYIGGSVLDAEKQALIEEINILRQQILDLNQTYLTISNLSSIT